MLLTDSFLDYLLHFKFRGDIYAMPEGTIMYPNEPVMTVVAPLIDAQLIETTVLLEINHQSLIATKTNRIVQAASGKPVSDFGARRAHNVDAAVYGAQPISAAPWGRRQSLQGKCSAFRFREPWLTAG